MPDYQFTLLLLNEGKTGLPHDMEIEIRNSIALAAREAARRFEATAEIKTGYLETIDHHIL